MAIKFTDDQRTAIDAKGTVLVSAAAGSGKTAVLTERVICKICDNKNPINADRLLIVTFTNASALEMRVRIAKRLDEVCEQNPNNKSLLKQKILLQNAKICTIDAFCIELVRKNFEHLGIKPDFKIAETSQTEILREKALNEVISEYYLTKNNDFDLLASSLGIDKSDKALNDAIFKIYDFSLCMSQPAKWLDNAVNNYDVASFNDNCFVKAFYENALIELNSCVDSVNFILREIIGTEFEAKCLEGFSNTLDTLNYMISKINSRDWDGLYNATKSFEKTEIGKFIKPKNAKLKQVISDVRNSIYNTITKLSAKMTGNSKTVEEGLTITQRAVSVLTTIVKKFSDKYFEYLVEKNIFTFSIIEQLALKLLCEEVEGALVPSKLSKDICQEFDEVLVDEYQDNNNLQDALFYALSDSGKNLFMVGDVKQSIYGFRNANPHNFLRHKDSYHLYDGVSSPSKVILKSNFRSRKGICDFVNAFCGTVMQNDTCSMEYTEEEKLVCGADYSENNCLDVDISITDINDTTYKREEADAETVAQYIENLLNAEAFLKSENGLRKAEFKDFAILLRSPKNRAEVYSKALNARNIPVSYETGEFYETAEIITVMSLLRVLNNPIADISLTSVMLSVVFGFTADKIAELKIKYNQKNMYANVCAAANNGDVHCSMLLNKISELRTSAMTLPVSKLLDELYKSTHIKEIMSAFADGSQRNANLIKLLSLAAKYDSSGSIGISGFINEFDRMAACDTKQSSNIQTDVNAVKILSIHGSKGLQFPICILADCGAQFNLTDINNSLIVNGDFGIGLKYIEPNNNVRKTTIARESISFIERKKMIAEEIRLFYVALTRAEERLMLSISSKKIIDDIISAAVSLGSEIEITKRIPAASITAANGYSKWILMTALMQNSGKHLCDFAGVENICNNNDCKFKTIVVKSNDNSDIGIQPEKPIEFNKNKIDTKLLDELKNRFEYKYPFENEVNMPSKLAVTELVKGDKSTFSFTLKPQFMSKSGLTPAQRGTAAHKFFQYANYSAAESDLDAEINRLLEWEFISEKEAESIDKNNIKSFFVSDIYKRIKNSLTLLREYKFMVEYPYNDSKTIVQGIADCIFEEDDGLVILDFKTDNVSDVNELCERYEEQLRIYKYAITQIFEKPVKECVLYSLQQGKYISINS